MSFEKYPVDVILSDDAIPKFEVLRRFARPETTAGLMGMLDLKNSLSITDLHDRKRIEHVDDVLHRILPGTDRTARDTACHSLRDEFPRDEAKAILTKTIRERFAETWKQMPEYLRAVAAADHMPVYIAKESSGNKTKDTALLGFQMFGAITIGRDQIRDPATVREELVHHVDTLVATMPPHPEFVFGANMSRQFTFQPLWKKAVDEDAHALKRSRNSLGNQLLAHYTEQNHKADAFHLLGSHFTRYTEALPDIIEIEAILAKEMKDKGTLAGIGGIGAQDTVETVMRSAFPHMWEAYCGRPEGGPSFTASCQEYIQKHHAPHESPETHSPRAKSTRRPRHR